MTRRRRTFLGKLSSHPPLDGTRPARALVSRDRAHRTRSTFARARPAPRVTRRSKESRGPPRSSNGSYFDPKFLISGANTSPPISEPTPDRFPPSTRTMRADAEAKAPVADKLSAYLAVLKREAEVYGARPKVEIKCDFSYTLSLPASKVDRDIVTVPEAFAGAAVAPVKALARAVGAAPEEEGKNAITEFPVLQDVQCAFRPGEITLVLAPPGHGKTALLKAVAGCLPAGAVPDDAVTYGGLTKRELENRGVSVNRLCAYVEQVDTHLPFLTVRETAAFSHDNSCPPPPDTDGGARASRGQARGGDLAVGPGGVHRHHHRRRLGARSVGGGEKARDHRGDAGDERARPVHGRNLNRARRRRDVQHHRRATRVGAEHRRHSRRRAVAAHPRGVRAVRPPAAAPRGRARVPRAPRGGGGVLRRARFRGARARRRRRRRGLARQLSGEPREGARQGERRGRQREQRERRSPRRR